MAGQKCMGQGPLDNKNAKIKNSTAYCEGRKAGIENWPGASQNPHPAGSETNVAWKAGLDSYSGPGGTPGPVDCCAERATTV